MTWSMAEPNTKAFYSTCVACLGFVCFAIGATAVGLPLWGYFEDRSRTQQYVVTVDSGYFGPWQVCKYLHYNREKCGKGATPFEPIVAVLISGLMAVGGVICLGIFCILSVLQMAMVTQRDKVVLNYRACVVVKLVLALLATMLAILAAGLFALQTDDPRTNFQVRRGESFYIQILLIVLDFALFIMSLYDVLFARRMGGDPTMSSRDPSGEHATTFNNPHFRERNRQGISMTDASGQPYARSTTNGSLASVATVTTTLSNGSSLTRSPLRSSLKKPRPPPNPDGLGIQNPGFSQGSPTMQRNGSIKKVRIQTHSTAV